MERLCHGRFHWRGQQAVEIVAVRIRRAGFVTRGSGHEVGVEEPLTVVAFHLLFDWTCNIWYDATNYGY
jgi:hypothetical protein